MKHQTIHINCVKYLLEHKLYREFDSNNRVVFSKKLRHDKSVRFTISDGGFEYEYDEHDRVTFNKNPNGFWELKYYDEPTEETKLNIVPYQVIHKYWHLYNLNV